MIGVEYAAGTVNRYKSSLNGLKAFILHKYNNTDIRLCDMNNIFIESYDAYLKSVKGLNHNSAAKNLKNLYSVLNKAVSYRLGLGWVIFKFQTLEYKQYKIS